MNERYVLDASATLCLIRGEPGADLVEAALPQGVISAVNLAEIIAKMVDLGTDDALIATVLGPLRLNIIAFNADQARASGMLRVATRPRGLSLGDRACLALALTLDATAMTTDRAWAELVGVGKVALAR